MVKKNKDTGIGNITTNLDESGTIKYLKQLLHQKDQLVIEKDKLLNGKDKVYKFQQHKTIFWKKTMT